MGGAALSRPLRGGDPEREGGRGGDAFLGDAAAQGLGSCVPGGLLLGMRLVA